MENPEEVGQREEASRQTEGRGAGQVGWARQQGSITPNPGQDHTSQVSPTPTLQSHPRGPSPSLPKAQENPFISTVCLISTRRCSFQLPEAPHFPACLWPCTTLDST